MNIHRWNVVNADGEIIGTVSSSINNRKIAFNKLKFKYPTTYYFLKLVKVKNKISGLGCDVELGGIGTNLKSISTLAVIGVGGYLAYKFKLFGGLAWLTNAFKDLKLAPETIAKFEDAEIESRVNQVDKMFGVLKQKSDNFNTEYGGLSSQWNSLKSKAVSSFGKESYKKTFYESAKMSYFGSKSSKEKLIAEIDAFRTKVLQALRTLQAKKGFKISGNWQVVDGLNCIPCLF